MVALYNEKLCGSVLCSVVPTSTQGIADVTTSTSSARPPSPIPTSGFFTCDRNSKSRDWPVKSANPMSLWVLLKLNQPLA